MNDPRSTKPTPPAVRLLLRRAAMGCVLMLVAYGLFVAISGVLPERVEKRPLAARRFVDRSQLLSLSSAFPDHFRSGRETPVQGAEQKVPWEEVARLMTRAPKSDHHGVVFHYGADGKDLLLALSPVAFIRTAPDSFTYDDEGAPFVQVRRGRMESAVKATWCERYQRQWFGWTGYFHGLEVRRQPAGDFERVNWRTDPHASVFAWEDDLLVMYRETLRGLDIGDSTLYLVIRSVSGPADPIADRDYQHRLCLFLRLEHLGGGRDLVDDVRHHDDDEGAGERLFRLKATDFGVLCPPSCGQYIRPQALHEYLSRDIPPASSSSAPY